MCRFVAYHGPSIRLADLITLPKHSIIHQSYHAKERTEPLNGDGFGLAWYAQSSEEPALFKDVSPAWNNRNLADLPGVVESRTVLAHVRAATQGLSVMRSNCHPFAYRQFAFMHNGNIGNFGRVRRELLGRLSDDAFGAIQGTTDSEHAFGLWIDRWREAEAESPLERMRAAMVSTIGAIGALTAQTEVASTLNLAVSDGVRFVASRAAIGDDPGNTLYWRRGTGLRCEYGVCRMDRGSGRAVLVASEPLFEPETWQPVPLNSTISVDADATVDVRPLYAVANAPHPTHSSFA